MTHRSRPRFVPSAIARSAALAVVLTSTACIEPPRDRGTLKVPSAEVARERAEALLTFAVQRDAAGVRGGLCPALAAEVPALFEPGQALAIDTFKIAEVEPVWVGEEPAFFVAVELTKNGAVLPRGLRVRSREGCVDQLLEAAPVGARPPERDEISL